jgi:hypothetical protein
MTVGLLGCRDTRARAELTFLGLALLVAVPVA